MEKNELDEILLRHKQWIENDTWYRCNICGREGRVGRCCSDEDRTPLNALAKAEQERTDKRKKVKQFEKKY